MTDGDLEALGKAALEQMDLEVARKAFSRLKNLRYRSYFRYIGQKCVITSSLRYLELIESLADAKKRQSQQKDGGGNSEQVYLADFYAFQVRLMVGLACRYVHLSTKTICTRMCSAIQQYFYVRCSQTHCY